MDVKSVEDCLEVVHADEAVAFFVEVFEGAAAVADVPFGEYILHSSISLEIYFEKKWQNVDN